MPTAPLRNTGRVRHAARTAGLLLAPCVWLWGCGGGAPTPPAETIGKETFVSTYVALRKAAMNVDSAALDSARTAILKQAGITAQDMLTFADVHGTDVAYMKDVWDEVESRLDKDKTGQTTAH